MLLYLTTWTAKLHTCRWEHSSISFFYCIYQTKMTSAVEPEIPMLSIEHGNHNSKVWPESSETTVSDNHPQPQNPL
jgi:hypothetical protein